MSTKAIQLNRLLQPLADCLTPDIAAKVADLRADKATQKRVDHLAERSSEGTLSERERAEYVGFLHAVDVIAILQAKARAILRKA